MLRSLTSKETSLEDYEQLYAGKKDIKVKGLYGKILKGRSEDEFQHITNDPKRRVVMLFGSDALQGLAGKSGLEALKSIGFTADSIRHRLDQGYSFKIVVFKKNQKILPATWDNVAQVCSAMYPNVAGKVKARIAELKKTPFSEIQSRAEYDFEKVKRAGTTDPNNMTYERLQEAEGSLVDVRAFLYHSLYLNNLFCGDGHTYEEGGAKGNKEYFAMVYERTLEELQPYTLIPLSIDI